jgi:hypothetical protein
MELLINRRRGGSAIRTWRKTALEYVAGGMPGAKSFSPLAPITMSFNASGQAAPTQALLPGVVSHHADFFQAELGHRQA